MYKCGKMLVKDLVDMNYAFYGTRILIYGIGRDDLDYC